ncbi:MAG: hypothetical protein KGJ90_02515 [Patescibacteria group bacterium]|nr:hypothetical protein [Patescibacteria group bacterium]
MKTFLDFIVVLIILFVAMWIWILWELRHAPEGYEDEMGFHEEKRPEVKK